MADYNSVLGLSDSEIINRVCLRLAAFRGAAIAVVWTVKMLLGEETAWMCQYYSKLARPYLQYLNPSQVALEGAALSIRYVLLKFFSKAVKTSPPFPSVAHYSAFETASFHVFFPKIVRRLLSPVPLTNDDYVTLTTSLESTPTIKLSASYAFVERLVTCILRHAKRRHDGTATCSYFAATVYGVCESALVGFETGLQQYLLRLLPTLCKKTPMRTMISLLSMSTFTSILVHLVAMPTVNSLLGMVFSAPTVPAASLKSNTKLSSEELEEAMQRLHKMSAFAMNKLMRSIANVIVSSEVPNGSRIHYMLGMRTIRLYIERVETGDMKRLRSGPYNCEVESPGEGDVVSCFGCGKPCPAGEPVLLFPCHHALCLTCESGYGNDCCSRCWAPLCHVSEAEEEKAYEEVKDYFSMIDAKALDLQPGSGRGLQLLPFSLHFVSLHQALVYCRQFGVLTPGEVQGYPNVWPDTPGELLCLLNEPLRALHLRPLCLEDPDLPAPEI